MTKTLTYTGNSPRPFGIRVPGYRARFDPANEKTLTLPAEHAASLLSADPNAWSEYVAPVVVPPLKEKPDIKKAETNGGDS